jgi:exosome complex component CSL4
MFPHPHPSLLPSTTHPTAANELGVIWAKSEIGNVMVPVSYQEMEDSVTGVTERRKVAKPEDL